MVKPELALLLIPLLPLAAGLLAHGLRSRPGLAAGICLGGVLASSLLGLQLLLPALSGQRFAWSVPWMSWGLMPGLEPDSLVPEYVIPLALNVGLAQLLFILTTALLSAGVLVYAIRDRQGDPRASAFFGNLTLFAGSMLLLLAADTLLLLYVAWELLGLFSFMLIAHKGTTEARRAGRQAFWTTRATDMGLLFAVFIMLFSFHWDSLSDINLSAVMAQLGRSASDPLAALGDLFGLTSLVVLLVLLAVIGKSAQWPLSFWLADAMVAPAPVSALLHAATLVAAGPYLLYMLRPLMLPRMVDADSAGQFYFAPSAALVGLTLAGGLTLVLGGLMAFFARDPKRVLAYSTVSQLGLYLCGIGLLAEHAAFTVLLVHAWAKAALFLAVGTILTSWHAARTEAHGSDPVLHDVRGWARGTVTFTLVLGAMALSGLPLIGTGPGKEELLWAAFTRSSAVVQGMHEPLHAIVAGASWAWKLAAMLLVLSIPLTAAYLTRLVGILAGWTTPQREAVESSPSFPTGAGPGIAAAMAIIGCLGLTGTYAELHGRLSGAADTLPHMPAAQAWLLAGLSLVLVLVGAVYAWTTCLRTPAKVQAGSAAAFFAHGMYLREFWHALVTNVGIWLAVLFSRTETGIVESGVRRLSSSARGVAAAAAWVDQHIVDGLRWQACEIWWRIRRWHGRFLQTGDVQHYMFVILICSVILCLVVIRPLSHIFAQMLKRLVG